MAYEALAEPPEWGDDDGHRYYDSCGDDGDDYDDERDEIEDALAECGRGHDYTGCTLAGTEFCDFECPFNR